MREQDEIVTVRPQSGVLTFLRDLYIWAKFSLIILGAAAVVMFIRLNFPVGEPLKLDTATTPILLMPNAIIQTPAPVRTK